MKNPSKIISFLGVDGSGKSTLINEIKKTQKNKFKTIKYLHLKPYFYFLDKRTVIKNPQNCKPLPNFLTYFKLFFWLIDYKLFFFLNKNKKNQLIIFDRYVHDLLVDPLRYKSKLSKNILKKILHFFPEPHLWIILKTRSKIIINRKNELSLYEITRQTNEYLKIAKTKKSIIIVNTNQSIKSCISIILKKIDKIKL